MTATIAAQQLETRDRTSLKPNSIKLVFRRKLRTYCLFFCFLTIALVFLGGCDSTQTSNQGIDTQWHRQDLQAQLTRWLTIAPTPSGLLLSRFDQQWHPIEKNSGSLVTHSRLIFAMVSGYELTGNQSYLDAATRGTDFLLNKFKDPVYGGFFDQIDIDGKVLNPVKNTYSHAFALLALSHVARVTKNETYRAAALKTWQEINFNLRDSDGGFRIEAARNFSTTNTLRNQNPVMHMFEALLALVDATGDPRALAGANSVGDFVLYKLLEGEADGGAYIPEWYDAQWKPLASKAEGGYIDIGHQFEWVHLLYDSEKLELSPLYAPVAERLLKYALRVGYDEIEGGAYNRVYPDGTTDHGKFLWQQAETLRTLLVAAAKTQRDDLWKKYAQTLAFIKAQMVDPTNGVWRIGDKQACAEATNCSTEQQEPYHIIGMHLTALNLSKKAAEGAEVK